jgi:hypothetical protein
MTRSHQLGGRPQAQVMANTDFDIFG